jgi:hypothetical protein
MSVFPLETKRVTVLNTALLFLVSIEPFLFNIVQRSGNSSISFAQTATVLYALDLAAMAFILGSFTLRLAKPEKKLLSQTYLSQFKFETISWFTTGSLFLVSAIAVQLDASLSAWAHYFWLLPIVFAYTFRNARERVERTRERRKKKVEEARPHAAITGS